MTAYISIRGRGEGCHADNLRFYWPSEILVVTHDEAPYLAVYSVEPDGVRYLQNAFYAPPESRCTNVAVSKGGKYIAVGGGTGGTDKPGVRVYERILEGYFPIYTGPTGSGISSVAFSYGDTLLLAVGHSTDGLKLYTITPGVNDELSEVVHLGDPAYTGALPIWDLKFSPDGALLAAAHGGGVIPPNANWDNVVITPNLSVYTVAQQSVSLIEPPFQDMWAYGSGPWRGSEADDIHPSGPLSGVAISFTSDSKKLALATFGDLTYLFLYDMSSSPPVEIGELLYTATNGPQSLSFYGSNLLAHAYWGSVEQFSVYDIQSASVFVTGLGVGFEATETAFSEQTYLAVSCASGAPVPLHVFAPVYEELPDGSQGPLIDFVAMEITDMVPLGANSLAFASAGNVLPPPTEEE